MSEEIDIKGLKARYEEELANVGEIPFKWRMLEMQRLCRHFEFDKTNKQQNYGYASNEGITSRVNQCASALGIIIENREQLIHFGFSGDEKVSNAATHTKYVWHDVFGDEVHTSEGLGQARDWGDKSVMKSSTASSKYGLVRKLLGCWGERDPEMFDPNKNSDDPKAKVGVDRKSSGTKSKNSSWNKTY